MTTWSWQDLVFFTVSVYGLSWLVTRAKISEPMRERMRSVPFLGPLLRCIVCTGTWIAMGLALILPWTSLVGLRVRTPLDLVLLVGWNVTCLWAVARLFGDAD